MVCRSLRFWNVAIETLTVFQDRTGHNDCEEILLQSERQAASPVQVFLLLPSRVLWNARSLSRSSCVGKKFHPSRQLGIPNLPGENPLIFL